MKRAWSWSPAVVFAAGAALVLGAGSQAPRSLRVPLEAAVPETILGLPGVDGVLSEEEVQVAGVDQYLFRTYDAPADAATAGDRWFTVYAGFYGSQTQGRTIHSPKNCLPGTGWEALESRQVAIPTAVGAAPVNRYVLQRDDERVIVLYWYQGRGRVQANEYLVKLDLLKDSALRQRSDEALVRVVVPIVDSEEAAFERAAQVAAELIPAMRSALPG